MIRLITLFIAVFLNFAFICWIAYTFYIFVRRITLFIAVFLNFASICWIAYTFYIFFRQQFHQKQLKNEKVAEKELEKLELKKDEGKKKEKKVEELQEVYEEISEKEAEVYVQKERETEDPHSNLFEVLKGINEKKRQRELEMALWRRLKDKYYLERALKDLRRDFLPEASQDSVLREFFADMSQEEDANLKFWYDQWILLENYLFGRRRKDFNS